MNPRKLRKCERVRLDFKAVEIWHSKICDLFQREKKITGMMFANARVVHGKFLLAAKAKDRTKCDNALKTSSWPWSVVNWSSALKSAEKLWRLKATGVTKPVKLGREPLRRLEEGCCVLGPFRQQEEIPVDQARGHNSRPQLSWGWVHVNPLAFGGEIQSGG